MKTHVLTSVLMHSLLKMVKSLIFNLKGFALFVTNPVNLVRRLMSVSAVLKAPIFSMDYAVLAQIIALLAIMTSVYPVRQDIIWTIIHVWPVIPTVLLVMVLQKTIVSLANLTSSLMRVNAGFVTVLVLLAQVPLFVRRVRKTFSTSNSFVSASVLSRTLGPSLTLLANIALSIVRNVMLRPVFSVKKIISCMRNSV
jgi:hypothetical protein